VGQVLERRSQQLAVGRLERADRDRRAVAQDRARRLVQDGVPAVARSAAGAWSAIAGMICGHAASGRSWPIPSTIISRAPGIARAVALAPDGATIGSFEP